MNNRHWSIDEIHAVLKKYADTKTDALAAELGRSEKGVYKMAHLLGVKKSKAAQIEPKGVGS